MPPPRHLDHQMRLPGVVETLAGETCMHWTCNMAAESLGGLDGYPVWTVEWTLKGLPQPARCRN
jgi:hypothetical protein